jgi:hypothetical protein
MPECVAYLLRVPADQKYKLHLATPVSPDQPRHEDVKIVLVLPAAIVRGKVHYAAAPITLRRELHTMIEL